MTPAIFIPMIILTAGVLSYMPPAKAETSLITSVSTDDGSKPDAIGTTAFPFYSGYCVLPSDHQINEEEAKRIYSISAAKLTEKEKAEGLKWHANAASQQTHAGYCNIVYAEIMKRPEYAIVFK